MDLFDAIRKADQEHLISHYQTLEDQVLKDRFKEQLKSIDFQTVNHLYAKVYKSKKQEQKIQLLPWTEKMTLQDLVGCREQLEQIGKASIKKGEVCICTLAGGQGSRLGFQFPKGLYDPKLLSGKTIFHYFSDHLKALTNLIKGEQKYEDVKLLTPWTIMTNDQTQQLVIDFFAKHNYFGINKNSIIFFPQQVFPAVDYQGKIIIDDKAHIFLNPNGNGGIYSSLQRTGTLQELENRKIKYVYMLGVDNILVRHADPATLGYHIKKNLTCTIRCLKKTNPAQKVGVVVSKNGRPSIVEYSQMPKQLCQLKNQKGQLVYNSAYPGFFVMNLQFIKKITRDAESVQKLNSMYHIAQKKIPFFDGLKVIKPQKNSGIKFELFIFDAFQFLDTLGIIQFIRQEQFAPIKNPSGQDSPESARHLTSALHRKWLEKAGLEFQGEVDGKTNLVEVDNILSYNGEGLEKHVEKYKGKKLGLPFILARA